MTRIMHVNGKFTDIYSYIKNILCLMVLMTVGASSAWAQTPIVVTTDPSNPVYYLFQSFGNTGFYMRPNGTKVSTLNILTDDMKWYFLESDEAGYYYICDKSGRYLYFSKPSGSTSNRTWMELKNSLDNSDKAHYKFSIAKNNSKGWDAYNIIPYGNTGSYGLNKQGRNAGDGNVQISSGYNDENSNWIFIPMSTYEWTLRADCFRPSDSSNKYYYKIKARKNLNYFIKPGATYVETSNTADDDIKWCFEEAASDDFMKYYYIRHANTGQYLRYRSTAVGQNDAIELANHTGSETGDAEARFQFIVVRGAVSDEPWNTTDIFYNIVPKVLKSTSDDNSIKSISNDKGLGEPLKTKKHRNSDDTQWRFELTTYTAPPTFSSTYNGTVVQVTINATAGATIYYTTNGNTPTVNPSNQYSGAITITDAMTEIKAIAVSDGTSSAVATLPIKDYNYYIVNLSNKVVIKHTKKQPAGLPLSNTTASIPTEILSSYISGEKVTFKTCTSSYAVGTTISQETLDNADPINATPVDGNDIYITYTNTHLGSKFLHLRGARPLNLRHVTGSEPYKYLKDNSGTIEVRTPTVADSLSNSTNYLWYISSGAGDPYDVWVQNNSRLNYVTFSSSAFSLVSSQTAYFITANTPESGDEPSYEDVTLKNVSNGETFTIRVNTVQISTSYHLIDKAGNEIFNPTSSTSDDLDIPDAWKSPLVSKYHFWKEDAFDTTDGSYKLKTDPAPTEIKSLGEVSSGEQIYVTYDVDPTFIIDTTESDLGNSGYMLHFTGGENFIQENGNDGLEASATKAEYPYSNGDACLYVYKADRWTSQMSSGASTRTRWLWHVVSPTGDPYHVLIMSHQGQASSHNFFRTYVVNYDGSDHLVTGVTTKHKAATDAGELPTEYRILRGALNSATGKYRCKLETTQPIDFGGSAYRTVTSFEQYWKNNPTVQNRLAAGHKVTAKETFSDNPNVDPTNRLDLPTGWHTYKAFANAAPWVEWKTDSTGSGKKYIDKDHWFQTVNMGSDFDLEAVELQPQVILVDNHGWEVMRQPMYTDSKMTVINTAALKAFDSPMVEQYHWYPTASKANGYHKFTCSNQEITVYNSSRKATDDRYTHNSTSLADIPYTHIDELYGGKYGNQDYRVKTDFYVTYTVKSEYANTYTGAATKGATQASAYLVKQGGHYAKISDSNTLVTTTTEEESSLNIESVPANLRWYVRPNFDIDAEMGYEYEGHYEEKDKADTEADNFAAGMNGFDPYNVQIQSAKPGADRLFTTNANGSNLSNGKWTSTYPSSLSTVSLQNEKHYQISADGLDQTTLKITNATFIVVDDGNGNMRLMPRFDNTKVVTSFTGLSTQLAAATAGDDGIGTQTLTLTIVPTTIEKASDIKSMGGYYMLKDGFTIDTSVGTSESPFKGTIDGQLKTIGSTTTPFVAYADGATIRNVILASVDITSGSSTVQTDSSALGAICNYATGSTRIYNCGILNGSVEASVDYLGGLVGLLDGSSRVINCYSYANVGGTTAKNVGGIVGYNNYPSTANDMKTMVMNCMFYGDITGGTNKSPVYGGRNISNLKDELGLNTFNYYSYEKLEGGITDGKYNCALAVEEKYLNRFEFYRLLLNSNKKLAAFYATGSPVNAEKKMAKWVLETADKSNGSPKPYPVLKEQGYYPSIINYDVDNAKDTTIVGRNKGGQLGDKTLTVNISESNTTLGGQTKPTGATVETTSLSLACTDKDFERFNFNYDKVQLPYYNDVGTKNYTEGKVVTGWKITAMSPTPASDPYTSTNYPTEGIKDFPDHNYADRKSVNKDLYGVSGRVFSQGAYFDVPYGVTSITIEPYWGNAAFVADANYDVVYDTNYGRKEVSQTGTQVGSDTKFNEKKVYTSIYKYQQRIEFTF